MAITAIVTDEILYHQEIRYHQFADPRLNGGSLSSKPYVSRTIAHVSSALRLRGPLAADPTARMLHALLVILVLLSVAVWVATIPIARVSFARIFDTAVLEASYATALVLLQFGDFRRASLAYVAGIWSWATLVFFSYGGIHSPGRCSTCHLPSRRLGSSDTKLR